MQLLGQLRYHQECPPTLTLLRFENVTKNVVSNIDDVLSFSTQQVTDDVWRTWDTFQNISHLKCELFTIWTKKGERFADGYKASKGSVRRRVQKCSQHWMYDGNQWGSNNSERTRLDSTTKSDLFLFKLSCGKESASFPGTTTLPVTTISFRFGALTVLTDTTVTVSIRSHVCTSLLFFP